MRVTTRKANAYLDLVHQLRVTIRSAIIAPATLRTKLDWGTANVIRNVQIVRCQLLSLEVPLTDIKALKSVNISVNHLEKKLSNAADQDPGKMSGS